MTEIKPGTPLPWTLVLRNGRALVYQEGADPMNVLSVAEAHSGKSLASDSAATAEANARYIVHTANTYPSLIAGLREAREALAALRRFVDNEPALNDHSCSGPSCGKCKRRMQAFGEASRSIAHLDTLLSQEGGQ